MVSVLLPLVHTAVRLMCGCSSGQTRQWRGCLKEMNDGPMCGYSSRSYEGARAYYMRRQVIFSDTQV